jgi:hypothetical protein
MEHTEQNQARRLTDQLQDYWDELRGSRNFPEKSDVNIKNLDKTIQNDCFIADVTPSVSKHNIKLDYLGNNLNSKYEQDEHGIYIRNLVVTFLETPRETYEKVIASKQPLMQSDEIDLNNGQKLKYRQILLPLGSNKDGEVTAILGGMRYKKD